MSWVDYNNDDAWSLADLKGRARAQLASEFDDAHDLQVKAAQLATGNGFMTADERTRWDAYVARKTELDTQVGTEWIKAGWVAAAMAIEDAQRRFYALPAAPPPPDPDPDYDERMELSAQINGAPPEVALVVAQRNRVPPPEAPSEEVPS